MNKAWAAAAAASLLLSAPDAGAQFTSGDYRTWAQDRVRGDSGYATAWYGENNWYNMTGQLGYIYTPAPPYAYGNPAGYYMGGGVPYYGGYPQVYGNAYGDYWFYDDDRDEGFELDL